MGNFKALTICLTLVVTGCVTTKPYEGEDGGYVFGSLYLNDKAGCCNAYLVRFHDSEAEKPDIYQFSEIIQMFNQNKEGDYELNNGRVWVQQIRVPAGQYKLAMQFAGTTDASASLAYEDLYFDVTPGKTTYIGQFNFDGFTKFFSTSADRDTEPVERLNGFEFSVNNHLEMDLEIAKKIHPVLNNTEITVADFIGTTEKTVVCFRATAGLLPYLLDKNKKCEPE